MRIKTDPDVIGSNFRKYLSNGSFTESAARVTGGKMPLEMLQAMAMSPNVLQTFAAFEHIYPNGTLGRPLMEKVILTVSWLHNCQFCTNSHRDMIAALGITANPFNRREVVAVDYAQAVTRDSNNVSQTIYDRLNEDFSTAEIVELTFLIGMITMLNRFNNALGVRYHGELAKCPLNAPSNVAKT